MAPGDPRFGSVGPQISSTTYCVVLRTLLAGCWLAFSFSATPAVAQGKLQLTLVDDADGTPVVGRMEVRKGRSSKPIPLKGAVKSGRYWLVPGPLELSLAPGEYSFHIEHGPAYRLLDGEFVIERSSGDARELRLVRIADMVAEGWHAGDLCSAVRTDELAEWLRSEQLAVAVQVAEEPSAKSVNQSPVSRSARDANPSSPREAGKGPAAIQPGQQAVGQNRGLVLIDKSSSDSAAADKLPAMGLLGRAATDPERFHVALCDPFAWNLPLWLASGQIDSFALLAEHQNQSRGAAKIAGRPPDRPGFGGPIGPGRWTEFVYWKMLDAGIRVPPVACSGSGFVDNPVGYNRVWVNVKEPFTFEQWWKGLEAGRTVVSNGPLLRPRLSGEACGSSFRWDPVTDAAEGLELGLELKLSIREPMEYIEVIHNGRPLYSVRPKELQAAGGKLPLVRVMEPGWVIVRVVTNHPDHLRMACSAPWYIAPAGQAPVRLEAVEFFQAWLREARDRYRADKKLSDSDPIADEQWEQAEAFWRERAALATQHTRD